MLYAGVALAFLVGLVIGELTGTLGWIVAALLLAAVGFVFARRDRVGSAENEEGRGWRAVERELSRSRRMERSFSLARLEIGDSVDKPAREELVGLLRSRIRIIDASWYAGPQLLMLLSETPRSRATAVVRRLAKQLPSGSSWSIAEYPGDGLTLEALLSSLDDPARSEAQVGVSDGAL